jgi:hypothetical protein
MNYIVIFLGTLGGASIMWALFVALENKGSAAAFFLALAGIAAITAGLRISKEMK